MYELGLATGDADVTVVGLPECAAGQATELKFSSVRAVGEIVVRDNFAAMMSG